MKKVNTKDELASLIFEIKSQADMSHGTKTQIIHDVKAAILSHAMIVESLAEHLTNGSDRDRNKLSQIRKHETILRIIIDKVVDAVSDHIKTKDPS